MFIKEKIKVILGLIIAVVKTCISYPIGRLIYGRKEYWLIAERPNQAQDNGYHFFRYMREHYPERKVYYVIEKDSSHLDKIAQLGDIIYFGSMKHWLMYFGCDAVISTHIRGGLPSTNWRYKALGARYKQKNKKIVFLQHGVISADIPGLYSENTNIDLFICGAKPEYDFVKENFHYHHDEVVYTGLARYDALYDVTAKKQILIMPTWRKWLVKSGCDLPQSEFVQEWNKVISDQKLIEAAKRAGYRIIFYLHSNLQFARGLFESVDDSVIIARDVDYDVQTLLKESALLITDFSSVFFDFAYMRKPMLFFHFDKERHAAEHYHKGYFDYERDGFGKVSYTAPQAAEDIVEAIENGAALTEEYNKRIDRFFPLYDRNNCKRIYDEIMTRYQK